MSNIRLVSPAVSRSSFYMKSIFAFALIFSLTAASVSTAASRNLILVTMDGVRTQEMFDGFQTNIWQTQKEGEDITKTELYEKFWAENGVERRERLWPFFWGTLMKEQGAIVGDRFDGSVMKLSNRHRFSYPGYSEILTGRANDKVIDSNSKIYNPNPTILEFLKSELNLSDRKVAAFASWDAMNFIVRSRDDAFFSNAGFEAYESADPLLRASSASQFETTTPWDSVRHDHYTFQFAMDYLERERPRVMFLSLGETDDWAHDKRYDRVIQAIHRSDQYFEQLWNWLQSQEDYRDQTTVLFATDHGRGDNQFNWGSHNDKLPGAAYVWMAAIGNGVAKRGNLKPSAEFSQNQIAATMCYALRIEPNKYHSEIGKPLELFFKE